ncbi:MAG: inner membrane-spanning protein YciB [Pseudomonadota bacterium]
MRQILELLPIVLFFVVYQMDGQSLSFAGMTHEVDGIFSATAVLIAATAVQVLLARLIDGSWEKRALWTLVAVSVFGGATLILRDQTFIQWKPTVFNWALAITFLGFHLFSERNLLQRILGSQIELPARVWGTLNWLWILNFSVVGALNLYVAYSFSEATWVSYKLYSAIGFTLALAILTAVIISPHLQAAENEQPQDSGATGDSPTSATGPSDH